ncbi:uncharacterized protein LOC135975227 isoform X2 [Chrysemys picta bellii]|uniref:uncharacterized protein LOC135975227 isoform X2 n=1 Tax=Chrysemys picta bellii TaxID=8478 RepID=UPI0032B2C499
MSHLVPCPFSPCRPVPPAAPQLSVSPSHPGYISGDSVTLTCSAPGGHTLSRIQFLKEGQNLDSQMPGPDPLNLSRALRLPPLAPLHSGAYSCGYWFLELGWEIPSGLSHPVHILVLEPPRSPWLTLAPRHPMYVPGERVTLRCSAPRGEGVATYRFYRQPRGLIADGVPEPTGGARLELRAETGTAGLYVCVYWTLHAGREVPSGESRPVAVSVTVWALREWGAATVPAGRRWDSVDGSSSQQHERCHLVLLLHLRGADRGREVPSYANDTVSVSVFPALAAPSLRLIPPLPLYVTGETVMAECVVPAEPYVPRAHWVLRDRETLREQLGPWFPLNVTPQRRWDLPVWVQHRAPQTPPPLTPQRVGATERDCVPRAGPNNTGQFSCVYEANISGRWIPAPQEPGCERHRDRSYWKSRELRRSRIAKQYVRGQGLVSLAPPPQGTGSRVAPPAWLAHTL